LIPQRNISLLSNRLAAGGGTRIREDVLERDYCLAWFLCGLSESDLRPALAFKGGTALKRCYFSDYRFSEDLDFTLREPLTFWRRNFSNADTKTCGHFRADSVLGRVLDSHSSQSGRQLS